MRCSVDGRQYGAAHKGRGNDSVELLAADRPSPDGKRSSDGGGCAPRVPLSDGRGDSRGVFLSRSRHARVLRAQLPGPVVERTAQFRIRLGDQLGASRRCDLCHLVHLRRRRRRLVALHDRQQDGGGDLRRDPDRDRGIGLQRGSLRPCQGDPNPGRQRHTDLPRCRHWHAQLHAQGCVTDEVHHAAGFRPRADLHLRRAAGLRRGDELPGPVVGGERSRIGLGRQPRAPRRQHLRHLVHLRHRWRAALALGDRSQDRRRTSTAES